LLKLLEQPLQPQQILFLTLLRLLSLAKTLTKAAAANAARQPSNNNGGGGGAGGGEMGARSRKVRR